jgi:hypothetical protein
MESAMRQIIRAGALLTVLLPAPIVAPSAFAQGSYRHHAWCLQVGGGLECEYDTLRQCHAAGRGRTVQDSCVRNTPAMNHP